MRYARLIDVAVPRVADPLFGEAVMGETSRVAVSGYPAVIVWKCRGSPRAESIIDSIHKMSDKYVPLGAPPVPGQECSENNN